MTCDRCGGHLDPDVTHIQHAPDCPKVDRPRWCAKSIEAWCAVLPDSEPVEGSWSVQTVCGYGITLPGGYARRETSCPDCRALLEVVCDCPELCAACCTDPDCLLRTETTP